MKNKALVVILNSSKTLIFLDLMHNCFIINLAVGGNWPGEPNETTNFPQQLIVDYVRVFQK